jgi:hypothetical protein
MDRRNLTEAAGTFRRGDSDSTMARMRRATGEALLGPLRNRRRNEALYNRHHREVRESREGDGGAGSSGEAEYWLIRAVERRLREEVAKLRVEVNEDKSRVVDLAKGESFPFLGFEFRRILSFKRKWRPYYTPRLKKRTALLANLRGIFRRFHSQPVGRVVEKINPILRGWVNYFRIGDSGRCFSLVQQWVERKVRRHLMRARKRKGMGWKRWDREWLYREVGLYADYRVRPDTTGSRPAPRAS